MKKFTIMSITLILAATLAFGGSLWYYFSTEQKKAPQKENPSQTTKETQASSENDNTAFPNEWQDNGIFSQYYQSAYEYMKNMTIEEKIGQLICVESPAQGAGNLVIQYNIGAVAFISDNFDYLEKENAKALVNGYQTASKTPLFTAVTEEGGNECDISNHYRLSDEQFASASDLFESGGLDMISDTETKKATLLKELGINTNFAPVCDIAAKSDQYMYSRSLKQDAATTKEFVANVTKVSQSSDVSVTLKHFPGYANNSEEETKVTDNRQYSELEQGELSVFKGGIDAGAHFVMLSNTVVNSIDSENRATFSAKTLYKLRNDLGFTGIAISAKLNNADSSESNNNPAVLAIAAGNDMVYVTDAANAHAALLNAVNNKKLDLDKIEQACMRILACKYAKELITK